MSSPKKENSENSFVPIQGLPPVVGTVVPEGGEDPYELVHYTWVGWSDVILKIREYVSLDQSQFGQMLGGYNRGQVGRFESGESDPPISFWERFTKVTSLSLTWVFTGLGNPYVRELQSLTDFNAMRRYCYAVEAKENEERNFVKVPEFLMERAAVQTSKKVDSVAKLRQQAEQTQQKRESKPGQGRSGRGKAG